MGAKVHVDYKNRPKGSPVTVSGLGTFKNGSTTELEDRVWNRFRAENPDYPDNHTFEFTTKAQEEASKSVEDMKKSELQDVAIRSGVPDATDLTKDELVEELK